MRAIQVRTTGGPEVLELAEVDDPSPGPGQLLVDVTVIGVNYIDTYHRGGVYPLALPFIPGMEGAGVVRALGDGVTGFAVGDRVAWSAQRGSYAEQQVIDAQVAVPIPDTLDDELAAAVLLQGLTAHYLVNSTYEVHPGDTILAHAAAGGVGLLLVQLAKAKGARVIGTVSTAEKERLAREAGADEVIRYTEVDVVSEVKRLTGGEGVPVVYDGVGRDTFEGSLACLRPRGVLALYGASSGQVPPFDLQRLNGLGSLYVTRPSLGHYAATRDELTWRAGEIFEAVADGTLSVRIGGRYPLEKAREAHEDLQARRTAGKLLLLPR